MNHNILHILYQCLENLLRAMKIRAVPAIRTCQSQAVRATKGTQSVPCENACAVQVRGVHRQTQHANPAVQPNRLLEVGTCRRGVRARAGHSMSC